MIRIIAVGKKHEDWVVSGIDRYQKRLTPPFNVEWTLLPHSTFDGDKARDEESERILRKLSDNSFVILLDERGNMRDSVELSELLDGSFNRSSEVTFVIGGAYGVNQELHDSADLVLSLSKLVFPHQLVRLLLVEQIYRAQEIQRGGKYHHA